MSCCRPRLSTESQGVDFSVVFSGLALTALPTTCNFYTLMHFLSIFNPNIPNIEVLAAIELPIENFAGALAGTQLVDACL